MYLYLLAYESGKCHCPGFNAKHIKIKKTREENKKTRNANKSLGTQKPCHLES